MSSNDKSNTDKLIDDVSGSTDRNQRAWAVGCGAVGGFFGGAPGAFIGARAGAVTGHAAQQVEKTIHKAGKSIAKVFGW